jgi:hypothetical protein
MDPGPLGWPRGWVSLSVRERLHHAAAASAYNQSRGQYTDGNAAQHHIERAGDLLGEIISIDRAIHPGRAPGR